MRRALVLAVVVVVGCASQQDRERARWPEHRKIEEGRITELEKEVKELSERIRELEEARKAPAPEQQPPPPPEPVP